MTLDQREVDLLKQCTWKIRHSLGGYDSPFQGSGMSQLAIEAEELEMIKLLDKIDTWSWS